MYTLFIDTHFKNINLCLYKDAKIINKTTLKQVKSTSECTMPEIINLLTKKKSTEKLILNLSLISGETILKEDTLVILDNLTNNEIAKGLKIFGSEHSKYNIIAITSRKEKINEFKAEELQFKSMNEMDFEEFLWAHDEKNLANLIKESFNKRKTCAFHKVALDLFQEYLVSGGLPEVVKASIAGATEYELDAIKQKIILN